MGTRIAPNPHSPYATADPQYRHTILAFVFCDPTPGALALTGCDNLSVVPTEPLTLTNLDDAPEGLCPTCVAAVQGQQPDTSARESGPCRDCEEDTSRDGLCVLCRQDLHDAWWPHRTEPTRTHLGWTLIHTTGPTTGENWEGPAGIPCQPTRADAEAHLASLPADVAAGLAVARDTLLCHTYTCACGTPLATDYGQTHYASAVEVGEVADDLGWPRRPDGGWDCPTNANHGDRTSAAQEA